MIAQLAQPVVVILEFNARLSNRAINNNINVSSSQRAYFDQYIAH